MIGTTICIRLLAAVFLAEPDDPRDDHKPQQGRQRDLDPTPGSLTRDLAGAGIDHEAVDLFFVAKARNPHGQQEVLVLHVVVVDVHRNDALGVAADVLTNHRPDFDIVVDVENLYLENYENVAYRSLNLLKENGILIKESELGLKFEVPQRPEGTKGFVVEAKRWVVERTFAWLNFYRRTVIDYERDVESSKTFLLLANISMVLSAISF